eukprot:749927-Hanusia_phi.AAC.2
MTTEEQKKDHSPAHKVGGQGGERLEDRTGQHVGGGQRQRLSSLQPTEPPPPPPASRSRTFRAACDLL